MSVLRHSPGRVRHVELALVLGGSAALAGSWVLVVADEQVPPLEAALFERVNGLPDVLWPVLFVPMQVGSLLGSLAIAGLATVRDRRVGLAALVASQLAFWGAKGIKAVVDRGRPSVFIEQIYLREQADGLGYISGHAAIAFALAAVIGPSLAAPWRLVAFTTATAVAVARVYAGVHLPLDVIGGAGFGVLLGTLVRWAFGLGGEGLPARSRYRR